MKWKGKTDATEAADDDGDEAGVAPATSTSAGKKGAKASRRSAGKKGAKATIVKNTTIKPRNNTGRCYPANALLVRTEKVPTAPQITQRCKLASGRTVEQALASVKFRDPKTGARCRYQLQDLGYDLKVGWLKLKPQARKGV